jgi:uncharacterized BrkB/YihY/UPF0761 family membrane protein
MTFEAKKQAALGELEESGIWRSNYLPPVLLFCWWLDLEVRPPHYNGFWTNAIPIGLFFAVLWGFFMWLFVWGPSVASLPSAAGSALLAGGLFGLFMGLYYRWSARRHGLSRWSDLPAEDRAD